MRQRSFSCTALALVGLAATACMPAADDAAVDPAAAAEDTSGQTYPNAQAAVPSIAFENDYIVVQSATAQPGVWAGEHGHSGNQFVLFRDAASVTYREAGEETTVDFEAGTLQWIDAVAAHDHAITSDQPVPLYIATLKRSPSAMLLRSPAEATGTVYPELGGRIVLDNDLVIVKHYEMHPELWTGVHSHDGDEISFILDPGTLLFRVDGEDTERSFAAGDILWTDETPAHEHAVVSETMLRAYVVKLR